MTIGRVVTPDIEGQFKSAPTSGIVAAPTVPNRSAVVDTAGDTGETYDRASQSGVVPAPSLNPYRNNQVGNGNDNPGQYNRPEKEGLTDLGITSVYANNRVDSSGDLLRVYSGFVVGMSRFVYSANGDVYEKPPAFPDQTGVYIESGLYPTYATVYIESAIYPTYETVYVGSNPFPIFWKEAFSVDSLMVSVFEYPFSDTYTVDASLVGIVAVDYTYSEYDMLVEAYTLLAPLVDVVAVDYTYQTYNNYATESYTVADAPLVSVVAVDATILTYNNYTPESYTLDAALTGGTLE